MDPLSQWMMYNFALFGTPFPDFLIEAAYVVGVTYYGFHDEFECGLA